MSGAALFVAALAAAQPLDDFHAPAAWRASASDGVAAASRPFEGGLRLDYDFSRGAGYAVLHRALPLDLPENFELRFRLRGAGPANNLELKLIDASGENVWWHRQPDMTAPDGWTTIRVRRRQIDFAWGPARDHRLRRTAAIEFVVSAGSGGGRGWIAVDDLELVPLPVPPTVPPPVRRNELALDLGLLREFGGLRLDWRPGAAPADYDVELSADGRGWTVAREVRGSDGGSDWLRLPDAEARFVRIRPLRNAPALLDDAIVEPLAFGASDNAFVAAVAAAAPRGQFPRGFIGEQNYWTLVAPPGGGHSGLIDEGGAIELGRGGVSIEPFVHDGDRLIGWADVAPAQSLARGDLPIPSVDWAGAGWRLRITALAGPNGPIGRYALTNTGAAPRRLSLMLAVRPFQVNPPQQFLNAAGGVSPIHALSWDGAALAVDTLRLVSSPTPDRAGLAAFDGGNVPAALLHAPGRAVDDPTGLAAGALIYELDLRPGETRTVVLGAPADLVSEDRLAAAWRDELDRVGLHGPPAAETAFATLRTALAQVLMSRDGPALRPGTRSYARSWIRDGAMMSTALLRLGQTRAAADFLA